MEFLYHAAVFLVCVHSFWQGVEWNKERKINAGHKLAIERLTARKHTLEVENERLRAQIDKARSPFGGLLSELPELFTDEEFATRAQKAEEGRALVRRLNDRYEGPKPTLGWDEQETNSIGSGI